jgi:1-acyl-sn-glycerol-3-phosphate acyltransferase
LDVAGANADVNQGSESKRNSAALPGLLRWAGAATFVGGGASFLVEGWTDAGIAPFRAGIERILAESAVPVIPLYLDGLWKSVFSRYQPRKLFRRVWSRVHLNVGDPLPPCVTAAELEAKVRSLAAGGAADNTPAAAVASLR